MNFLKMYYLVAGLVCNFFCSYGQDRIYYKESKVGACEVTEVTPAYIKGVNLLNPPEYYSASLSDVLFIFNKTGSFLVTTGLYDNPVKAQLYIKNFLAKGNNALSNLDKIITNKNDVIVCNLISESEKVIEYTVNGKNLSIPKSEVGLIIYKDGYHKLFSNWNKSLKILGAVQDEYHERAFPPAVSGNHDISTKGNNIILASSSAGSTEKQSEHAVKTDSASSLLEDTKKQKEVNMELDSATLSSLQLKAILNLKELETYIKIISGKDLNDDQINNVIEQALSLFINEDAMVEVSSKNRSKVQLFKIKVYLSRLGFMKYSKVIIDWYNVQYASKVRLNPDGTYTGIVEFEQKFTGISGDKKVYEDITRKTVEVFLKPYNKKLGGENIREWNVFLGNIGISVMEPK